MNKLLTFLVFLLPLSLFAQLNNVGINTATPDSSAVLDIKSTEGGILIPRMTLFQRDVIKNPATGLMVYQTDFNPGFHYYNGTRWTPVAKNNNSSATVDEVQTLIYTTSGF